LSLEEETSLGHWSAEKVRMTVEKSFTGLGRLERHTMGNYEMKKGQNQKGTKSDEI